MGTRVTNRRNRAARARGETPRLDAARAPVVPGATTPGARTAPGGIVGSGQRTGEWKLPPQYQFAMPAFPSISTPDYNSQAQGDTELGYNLYKDTIASQQRQLEDQTAENLARSADVWGRYQSSIAPIGGALQSSNSATMNQMGGLLSSVYGNTPGAASGGLASEQALGQSAVQTGGTGQLGILANMAQSQQGMQAGYQREGAVDAADQGRHIIMDAQAQEKELNYQLADYAKNMPELFNQRLNELRSQGMSDELARFQLAMEWQSQLSSMASDQAYAEWLDWKMTHEAAKKPDKKKTTLETKYPNPTNRQGQTQTARGQAQNPTSTGGIGTSVGSHGAGGALAATGVTYGGTRSAPLLNQPMEFQKPKPPPGAPPNTLWNRATQTYKGIFSTDARGNKFEWHPETMMWEQI